MIVIDVRCLLFRNLLFDDASVVIQESLSKDRRRRCSGGLDRLIVRLLTDFQQFGGIRRIVR